MTIDEVYRLVNYVANKTQSGNTFTPAQFNLIAKMAQLVPIIGAPVGAVANYALVKKLGKTAKNAYRMRDKHLVADYIGSSLRAE